IEKSVEVRAGIKAIRYSQKSVGLDVALRLKKEVSSVDKRRIEKPFSTSGFGSEDKPSDAALPPAPKSNEPNRMSRLGSSLKFDSQQMAGFSTTFEITLPLNFPNIAHGYWKNYKLTGEFSPARSKLSV
ncbi:MAG TPA: hypothetical protein PK362_11955, partial [Elusimicrobiota bacterium]|nr:hypothetical protein [Elusimicrobiota bacterium]